MQCANCGDELLQGQRFCRACGAQVDVSVPTTQGMDTALASPVKVNPTTPAQKPDTNPVAQASNGQTTYMQAPQNLEAVLTDSNALPQPASAILSDANNAQASPAQSQSAQASIHSTSPFQIDQPSDTPPADFQTTPPAHVATPVRAKKSFGWVIAFGAIALVGVIFFAALMFGYLRRAKQSVTPPPPTTSISKEPTEQYLSEEAARITVEETVFLQKFPLPNSAKFSLSNLSGAILIEGVDSSEAEIKVTKRGGSIDDRRDLKIIYSTLGGNLSLKPSKPFANGIDIVYEIKLPRNLGTVNIDGVSSNITIKNIDALLTVKSVSGILELSNLSGAVNAETQSGEIFLSQSGGNISAKSTSGKIELSGVSGSIATDNTAGNTEVSIDSTSSSDRLSFESINGSIALRFPPEINAELEAHTVSGSIQANSLGVEVKKVPGSQQAVGRLGIGGQPLKIKTVSGDIIITKRS